MLVFLQNSENGEGNGSVWDGETGYLFVLTMSRPLLQTLNRSCNLVSVILWEMCIICGLPDTFL